MRLEKELRRLSVDYFRFKQKAEKQYPQILADFNSYIATVNPAINFSVPNEWEIGNAGGVHLENGTFVIEVDIYHNGKRTCSSIPEDIRKKIDSILKEYGEIRPGIEVRSDF